jgi:Ca-activated chloride channel family protein
MKHELNDETLTAYALGELDAAETMAVEELLSAAANAGNDAPRKTLEEILATVTLTQAAFADIASDHELTGDQRDGVISFAQENAARRRTSSRVWASVAATLLLLAGAGIALPMLTRAKPDSIAGAAFQLAADYKNRDTDKPSPLQPEQKKEELRYQPAKETGTAGQPQNDSVELPKQAPYVEGSNENAPAAKELSGADTEPSADSARLTRTARAPERAGSVVNMQAAATPGPPQLLTVTPTDKSNVPFYLNQKEQLTAVGDADSRDRLRSLGYIEPGAQFRTSAVNAPQSWGWQGRRPAPAEPPSAEAYQRIVDSGFVRVTDQPLSTFSIDVDTASYANVRRFLDAGQLPPPDAVRVEELINYFDYSYPAPEGGAPFAAHFEAAACPWAPEHALVRIGLKGREVPRAQRPATNLVFLIDVSGSMQPENKLPLAKRAMAMLTRQLDERDRVSIVTYASGVNLALPVTNASRQDAILGAIENLGAGGSTNGAGGIQLAYQSARENFLPGGVNRVILATDGDFNVGLSDNDSLLSLIQQEAKSGVFLSVFGFGMGNLKDDKLELLADKGNGVYGYIDSESEARKVFVEKLSGTLVTIAKDVKIQVEFNPARVAAYRLVGYENRALAAQDFNDDRKDAGEIGAGHTVTALYEVIPAGKAIPVAGGAEALRYQSSGGRPAGDTMPLDLGLRNVDEYVKTGRYAEAVAMLDVLRNTHLESFDVLTGRIIEVKKAGGLPLAASEQSLDAARAAAPAIPPTHTDELLLVKLRYKEPAGAESKLLEFPLKDSVSATLSSDLKFASAVAAFGKFLRGTPLGPRLNYDGMMQLAQAGLAASDDPRRAELIHLMLTARPLIEEGFAAPQSIDLVLRQIREKGDGSHLAQIRTPSRTAWYATGESFESYTLTSINPQTACVTIFAENLQKTIEVCLGAVQTGVAN